MVQSTQLSHSVKLTVGGKLYNSNFQKQVNFRLSAKSLTLLTAFLYISSNPCHKRKPLASGFYSNNLIFLLLIITDLTLIMKTLLNIMQI